MSESSLFDVGRTGLGYKEEKRLGKQGKPEVFYCKPSFSPCVPIHPTKTRPTGPTGTSVTVSIRGTPLPNDRALTVREGQLQLSPGARLFSEAEGKVQVRR